MAGAQNKTKNQTGDAPTKWALFFGLFLCLFQLFISFPIAVWKRNKFNFEAPLTYSYSVLGLTFLAIATFSIFIALLTPRKLRYYLAPILIVLSAVLFIQQNFMAWNYGILDGHALDFKKNAGLGYLDLIMWGVALGALLFMPKLINRQSANILLGVGAMTVIGTAVNVKSYGSIPTPYTIDERAKFDFSKDKNIIVFLFDAYQMDVFLELADTQPELVKPLEGFTAYVNNAAVFAKTYPTIPLFLTGKRYQKKEPLLDFFKIAYKDSLVEKLQDEGWDIGLYPHLSYYPSLINSIDIHPRIMDNAIGGVPNDAKITTYLKALNLSVFRAVPHGLKPAIFNDGEFVFSQEKALDIFIPAIGETDTQQPFKFKSNQKHAAVGFKDLINQHGQLATDDPAFRFYHFMLPHSPFILDENLTSVKHQENFEAYKQYSIAGLKLMGEYLERLKEIGAYDNSTIMIVSDHGMGVGNFLQYESETQEYRELKKWGYRRASAKSIFLVKPPEQRGALSRSVKPVSGIDVAPTISAAAGLKTEGFEGKNVDDISLDENRSRIFNFYTFSTWDSKYLEDFETYEITGDVLKQASWNKTGVVTENTQIKNKESYQLGEIMSFGKDSKTDSDFLNAFIALDKYRLTSNYIEAENGIIDVAVKLKTPPRANESLLLQFEIYSGEAVDRKIIVNGEEMTAFIKPKMRQLNRGFFISPDVHKGTKIFNLSFAPVDAETALSLRLSSIKLSVLKPTDIAQEMNFLKNINDLFPVGFEQKKAVIGLPVNRVGSLIFSAASDICKENSLKVKFKSKPMGPPRLALNNIPLEPISPIEEEGTAFSYNCSNIEITNNNILEVSISKAESDETMNEDNLMVDLQEISFK